MITVLSELADATVPLWMQTSLTVPVCPPSLCLSWPVLAHQTLVVRSALPAVTSCASLDQLHLSMFFSKLLVEPIKHILMRDSASQKGLTSHIKHVLSIAVESKWPAKLL